MNMKGVLQISLLMLVATLLVFPVSGAFAVTGINPSEGINTGSVSVNVSGTNLPLDAYVNLTKSGEIDISGQNVTQVDSTRISCDLDLTGKATGAWNVLVVNKTDPIDTGFRSAAFTILYPAPIITGIDPASGLNSGPVIITNLSGTGFIDGAEVSQVSVFRGITIISASGEKVEASGTRINCTLDLTGAEPGIWSVRVTNPDDQSAILSDAFTISYPAPVVESITPGSGKNNEVIGITNLSGSNFREGATVYLNKTGEDSIPTINDPIVLPDKILCFIDLNGKPVGAWNVVVANSDGQYDSLPNSFTIYYPHAPTVTGITPANGFNDRIIFVDDLAGTGFEENATVVLKKYGEIDINAKNVTVTSPYKITFDINLTGAEPGKWDVLVTNNDGQYGIKTKAFTVVDSAPKITNITPNKGPNTTPVNEIIINGTNFDPDIYGVRLRKTGQNDIIATDVIVESTTRINCTFDLTGRAPGYWNVIVRNADGQVGRLVSGFEIIPPPPIADFTGDPLYGTAPLTVQFTDHSTNNPNYWSWAFGDGTAIGGPDQQNPAHTYQNPGVYNVTLQAYNSNGWDDEFKQEYITVVREPVANFSAEPRSGSAPLQVKFTDTSDGNPTYWIWQFGDNTFSLEKNPYHVYENPGVYTVKLTVRNKDGTDSEIKTDWITATSLPEAEFIANRTTGFNPLAVQFIDKSTGEILGWEWKFGDGGTNTTKNPVHVFENPGIYSVQLKVANEYGEDTNLKEGYITVSQELKADFKFITSNPENTTPLTVAFWDTSLGNPMKYKWSFGDGYTSTEKNPIHNYAKTGVFPITLTISNLMSSDSITKTIEVTSPLVAEFYSEPTYGSAPLTVQLFDISVGEVDSRSWVLRRGDAPNYNYEVIGSGEKNQIYTINEPGVYTVQLIVRDINNNENNETKFNYITVYAI